MAAGFQPGRLTKLLGIIQLQEKKTGMFILESGHTQRMAWRCNSMTRYPVGGTSCVKSSTTGEMRLGHGGRTQQFTPASQSLPLMWSHFSFILVNMMWELEMSPDLHNWTTDLRSFSWKLEQNSRGLFPWERYFSFSVNSSWLIFMLR